MVVREENAAVPALAVRVHLHVPRVDGGVDHSPGSPSELRLRWDVDQHRLPVFPQTIHDVGTELQHLVVHVCGKRTRRLKPQHVSAPAPPRMAKLGDKDSHSALLTTSCYRTASSGPEGLRQGMFPHRSLSSRSLHSQLGAGVSGLNPSTAPPFPTRSPGPAS